MYLVEALKERKRQFRKAEDLRGKVARHCADIEVQEPTYGSVDKQKAQVSEWLQAHADCMRNITDLTMAISRTNLETYLTVTVGEKPITQTIAYWVTRRTEKLCQLEKKAWAGLTERGLAEKSDITIRYPEGAQGVPIKRRLYFDPKERDARVEQYTEEEERIDAALEHANATTEVIGLPDRWTPKTT